MPRLLLIAQENDTLAALHSELVRKGSTCSIIPHENGVVGQVAAQHPDLVMVAMDGSSTGSGIQELVRELKQEHHLPVIALVPEQMLDGINGHLGVADDFITGPYDSRELVLRIERLLRRNRGAENKELIECDGLVIDFAACEVTLEGKKVALTFKEFELLKLLAGHRGRVYTREALLDRVWGHDYYGGDRTVDVHIRRLRSKIEDSRHSFIDTVRNIGYRFRKDI